MDAAVPVPKSSTSPVRTWQVSQLCGGPPHRTGLLPWQLTTHVFSPTVLSYVPVAFTPSKATSRTPFTCRVGVPAAMARFAPVPVTIWAWHTEHSYRFVTTCGEWEFAVALPAAPPA